MDTQDIIKHITELKHRITQVRSANNKEESLRPVFIELLNRVGSYKNMWVIPEQKLENNKKPDSTIKTFDTIHGHHEAKSPNQKEAFKKQIQDKIKIGYPTQNIIFENSNYCYLFQNGQSKKNISSMWDDPGPLSELLVLFFDYESPDIKAFHQAQKRFSNNLPELTKIIRQGLVGMDTNKKYIKQIDEFVLECQKFINPYFEKKNVEDWLVQHILTEQIFLKVFGEQQYHKYNNISATITNIEREFLREIKGRILDKMNLYIAPITNYGNKMYSLPEKQLFLKKVYQEFYNAYDKKIADRFGIIYTPNEIVKFIVESTNEVLKVHFNKELKDKNVHILDPATGTGTFITQLIEHIFYSSDIKTLRDKYNNEIHANEISVLPYYVANLSIEYTYTKLVNKSDPFPNLVLMDTLQNSSVLNWQISSEGKAFSENQVRVKKQNTKEIQVVLGNPPYNQHQQTYGDNNPNKHYPELKQRIKSTYGLIKAKKEKILQDKYIYFLRWASDRIDKQGVISFVLNRSFLNATSGAGVRASLEKEFDYIYILDLGGSLREGDPPGSNVFGIKTGVAIMFLVKTGERDKADIKYIKLSDTLKVGEDKATLKLSSLHNSIIRTTPIGVCLQNKTSNTNTLYKKIIPNEKHEWLNKTTVFNGKYLNDFFIKESFLGIVTNRDKDVYDTNKERLTKRMKLLIQDLKNNPTNPKIKLSTDLAKNIKNGRISTLIFDSKKITSISYRENEDKYLYADLILCDRLTRKNHFKIWGTIQNEEYKTLSKKELVLVYELVRKDFRVKLVNKPFDKNLFKVGGHSARGIWLKYLTEDIKKNLKNKINQSEIKYYVIGLFFSKKYKLFMEKNNFDIKNPPIPIWDEHIKDYIKDGKKRILELRKKK